MKTSRNPDNFINFSTLRIPILGLVFYLILHSLFSINAFPETIYSWEDKEGVLHFSDRKPSGDAIAVEKYQYQSSWMNPSTELDESQNNAELERQKYEALIKAESEKSNAIRIKKEADKASIAAKALKEETEAYIDKVIHKSRNSKSLRYKIKKRIENLDQAMSHANDLHQKAIDADQKVLDAMILVDKLSKEPAN